MVNQTVNNQHSASNDDILLAINDFASQTEERFIKLETRFDGLETRFDGLETRFNGFEQHSKGLEQRLKRIEKTMVTKDYLDERLSDLRGDLVVMMRKEDTKLITLVGVLEEKKVLDKRDVKRIYSMEPFAQ